MTQRVRIATPLRKVIDDEGRKQSWLSERAGIDQPTLSRIVNGRLNPTEGEQLAIAAALERPVAELFPIGSEAGPVERAA